MSRQPAHSPATSLSSQIVRPPLQRPINYRFLHRGAVLMATPVGIVRVEMFQKRSFDRLSLSN